MKEVFSLLGENVSDDEVSSKLTLSKVVKSNVYSHDKDSGGEIKWQDKLQGIRRLFLQNWLIWYKTIVVVNVLNSTLM